MKNTKTIIAVCVVLVVVLGAVFLRQPSVNHGMTNLSGSSQNDTMRDHCKMMPEMVGCDKYKEENDAYLVTDSVDRSIVGLQDAQVQSEVVLDNNANYDITASFVKKTIGGHSIRMLAYNGQIPGPLLKVKQNSTVNINFKNNLDEETTIHWHGLRLDNKFDGVPDVTQLAVKPGGSFRYELKFPDAGLYWYHPHTREDYEQNLGMYGMIWVEPTDQSSLAQVNQTAYLALSDILLQGSDVYPFSKSSINFTLMGRFGNQMLVNGETNFSMTAQEGDVVRMAVVNVANTRLFRFAIPGAKIKLVGGDSGWYNKENFVDAIVLSPSERAIIDVSFPKAGDYLLKNETPAGSYTLGVVKIGKQKTSVDYGQQFSQLKTHELDENGMVLAQQYLNKPVDEQINLTIDMPGMMGNMQMNHMAEEAETDDGIEWEDTMAMMNQNSNEKALTWIMQDKKTGAKNEGLTYVFKRGQKVKVRIFNDPNSMHAMQHVIHFHGNRFLVLSTDGKENKNLVWKDSALIPKGAIVDILLDASNPGDWMVHCHIAEHLLSSMMINYKVE